MAAQANTSVNTATPTTPSHAQIFLSFLWLGLTSFGGPVAHIGYFRVAFVDRNRWITATGFQHLLALCHMLPGPSSSQLGFALGVSWRGLGGGVLAFVGFTLPSALMMIGFGYGLVTLSVNFSSLIMALKLVTAAVVLHAVIGMAKGFALGVEKVAIAIAMAAVVLWVDMPFLTPLLILGCGGLGLLLIHPDQGESGAQVLGYGRNWSSFALVLFVEALAGLLLLAHLLPESGWFALSQFYLAGTLVFGGGHVVLPLLEASVVDTGLVSLTDFLAGYGMAQVMPGPLFTFGGFLGAVMGEGAMAPLWGAVVMLVLFLPSFLLLLGVLPYWQKWMLSSRLRAALAGINAGVVGLLAAVLINPVLLTAIRTPQDGVLVATGLALLLWGRINPIVVILAMLAAGWGLGLFGAG
jgi:chromate transporter